MPEFEFETSKKINYGGLHTCNIYIVTTSNIYIGTILDIFNKFYPIKQTF